MKLRKAWYAAGAVMALAVSGCIIEVDFDPVGTDATVEGNWQINGAAPNAANCAAIGISNVRVRFYEGGSSFDHSDLVFPCADGGFRTSAPVLKAGDYNLQVLGVDGAGQIIAEGPRQNYSASVGGNVLIDTVDFVSEIAATQVRASWTINGGAASATTCDAAGIASVTAAFDGGSPMSVSCATGGLIADIAAGAHDVVIHAVDSNGANITTMGFEQSFTVTAGQTLELNAGNAIDFVVEGFSPMGTDANLTYTWTIGTTAAGTDACEVVNGVSAEIQFFATTDTARAEGVTVAMATCDNGTFTSTTPILRNGNYLASIILRDTTGAEVGGTDLDSEFAVAGGTLDMGTLDIRLPETVVSVQLEWADPADGNATVACGAAGGPVSMFWAFVRQDTVGTPPDPLGIVVEESTGEMDTCEQRFTFTNGSATSIPLGGYWFEFEGNEAARNKAWSQLDRDPNGACGFSVAAEGDLILANCKAPYLAP